MRGPETTFLYFVGFVIMPSQALLDCDDGSSIVPCCMLIMVCLIVLMVCSVLGQ